jgi:hydrophobic surface binding protein A
MKFASSFVTLVASLALADAAPMAPQDMITMQQTFDQLFIGVDKAVADIRKFNGDPTAVAQIAADLSDLRKTTVDGAAKTKTSPAMGIPDALTILGPVGVLADMLGELVDTLSKKKPELTKAGATKQILDGMTNLRTAAEDLGKAIVGGLPLAAITSIIGTPIANLVIARIDVGVKEWSATLAAQGTTA